MEAEAVQPDFKLALAAGAAEWDAKPTAATAEVGSQTDSQLCGGPLLTAIARRKKQKKTRKDLTVDMRSVYLGTFYRLRGLGSINSTRSYTKAAMVPMLGLVTGLLLPFTGLTVPGCTPFTSYPLALELSRLGLEEDELEGKGLEIREEQRRGQLLLDDSGWGMRWVAPWRTRVLRVRVSLSSL